MQAIIRSLRTEIAIIIVLLLALLLRLKGLDNQSLWLDELHTMNEAGAGWNEMFGYFKCCDQHPPLYFIVVKLFFSIFGHTAYVARIVSVIAGTTSVWAMYRLGKEVLNKPLGITCALLTAVNFYNLSYSQEARPYIFAFLFAALSFVYFIRLIRSPSAKIAIIYAIMTLLLLYSHYFSLFVVAAQALLALIFLSQEKKTERKIMFRAFVTGGAIIAVGYAPWLPFLKAMTNIKSFWITEVSPASLQNFFFDYFGNSELLKPLLLILLFVFVAKVAFGTEKEEIKHIKSEPLLLSFIMILCWIFIVFLIPYLRSILVVPMLYPRYTIVVVPAVILLLAYSLELFKVPVIKYSLISLFLVLSLIHLFFVQNYYKGVSKTQFREMTAWLVKENSSNYPVINEKTSWHQEYYLKQFGSKAEIFTGKKEALVDSILAGSSPKYRLNSFWIVGAHHDNKLDSAKLKYLDSAYRLVKQKAFYDAWAELYTKRKGGDSGIISIRYNDFAPGEGTLLGDEKKLAIWNGAVHSKQITLEKSTYTITITASGTEAAGQFPHLNIYSNGVKITDYFVTGDMQEKIFDLSANSDTIVLTIEMDNDYAQGNADRNAFIESILLEKKK